MPELPEVETTRRGVAPYCEGRVIESLVVREHRMRWPVPADMSARLQGQTIERVDRRGKYLLFRTAVGSFLVHLGMSGSLRVVSAADPVGKHDHIDLVCSGGAVLRFNDPRRFGSWLWIGAGDAHPLLDTMGPEPLGPDFDGELLYRRSRGRKGAVKNFIMDGKIVVGVGNIYANEALFAAGILPQRAAGRVSRERYDRLAAAIREILGRAIEVGGTTLRDFVGGDGKPGYFKQSLYVYGRQGEDCKVCSEPLKEIRLGQRSTVYCPRCQR